VAEGATGPSLCPAAYRKGLLGARRGQVAQPPGLPPDAEWTERAHDMVTAPRESRFDDVHQSWTPQGRAKMTAEQLRAVCEKAFSEAGQLGKGDRLVPICRRWNRRGGDHRRLPQSRQN
jgi:hypothetical protein